MTTYYATMRLLVIAKKNALHCCIMHCVIEDAVNGYIARHVCDVWENQSLHLNDC